MPKTKFWNTDKIIAISAMAISLGTFAIYLYQTHLIRTQQYAAVWPNLELGPNLHIGTEEGYYKIVLENTGVGPAIIEDVNILYKGKQYPASFWQFFQKEFKSYATNISSSDLYKGRVIQAGKEIEVVSTTDLKTAKKFLELFSGKDDIVTLNIKYRSIYNEYWKIENGFNVAQKVEE